MTINKTQNQPRFFSPVNTGAQSQVTNISHVLTSTSVHFLAVFDHVTISGDAKRKNKTSNEDTERPGGFGVIFGQNTSGEMRHCRVVHHELSGIQARAGAILRLENCDVSSNGGQSWLQTSLLGNSAGLDYDK